MNVLNSLAPAMRLPTPAQGAASTDGGAAFKKTWSNELDLEVEAAPDTLDADEGEVGGEPLEVSQDQPLDAPDPIIQLADETSAVDSMHHKEGPKQDGRELAPSLLIRLSETDAGPSTDPETQTTLTRGGDLPPSSTVPIHYNGAIAGAAIPKPIDSRASIQSEKQGRSATDLPTLRGVQVAGDQTPAQLKTHLNAVMPQPPVLAVSSIANSPRPAVNSEVPVHDIPLFEGERPRLSAAASPAAQPMTVQVAQRGHTPQIASQIAAALVQSQGGTTQIALNPEELGRVRISLTSGEGGLTVSILAERPETADLMRRNLDSLARDFADLGYESLSFNFEDPREGPTQSREEEAGFSATGDGAVPTSVDPLTPQTVAVTGGLDLKL